MNVHVLPAGPIQTNAFLLTSGKGGDAVLVDAPEGIWGEVKPLLDAEGCRIGLLLLTHGHWDHTQGAAELVRRTGAKVYAHRGDQRMIETPEVIAPLMLPGITVEAVPVDRWLEAGETLDLLGDRVRVSHVPGHSPGSLSFYFPASKAVFSGDALFRGAVGRTDLPGGDFAQLETSIRSHLYNLDPATVVFPGHGEPTSVGEERSHNPYVRA